MSESTYGLSGAFRWTASVDSEAGILLLELDGTMDFDAWRVLLGSLPDLPGMVPGLDTLVDARKARLDFFFRDGQRLVEVVEEYLARRGPAYRSAWVVATDPDYGVSRMVQTVLESLPIEAAVFRDMGDARVWLGADSE